MLKYLIPSLLFCLVSCKSTDLNSLSPGLQTTIKTCRTCHNDLSNPNRGPNLDGMQKWYIIEQLANFRNDKRGSGEDPKAALMTAAAKSVNPADIDAVADWFEQQPVHKAKPAIKGGDLTVGGILYNENCRGCHSSSIGRFFTGSPKIEHIEGDYLFDQLKKFREGQRTFVNPDKHKEKMIVVAKRFNDEQFKNIVAYIESLK